MELRIADAAPRAASRKRETPSAAGFSRYAPYGALMAWIIAVAYMAGPHFEHPVRTIVQQVGAQGAERARAAEDPRLDPVRTAAIPEPSRKVERSPVKSPAKASKPGGRIDRIGLKIATLLADAPADGSGAAARVAPKPEPSARHDAFDPFPNLSDRNAPVPPMPIGPTTTASNATLPGHGGL